MLAALWWVGFVVPYLPGRLLPMKEMPAVPALLGSSSAKHWCAPCSVILPALLGTALLWALDVTLETLLLKAHRVDGAVSLN